jgi:TPR repeat protein
MTMRTSFRTLRTPALLTFFVCVAYIPSGYGVSPEEAKVARLQIDAQRGAIGAELELAAHYVTGTGVPRDASLAAHWYEQAARSGDADAQNQIGHFYQVGFGVPIDFARARNWYQLASVSGSASGKLNLGVLYLLGLGVPKDATFARQLFEVAAGKGNGTAAAYLGAMYYFGSASPPDRATAEKWFERGVKLHDPIAGYNLASLFSVTPDHAHDFRKAANLLRDSARAGYVPSMHSLGLLLVNHPELEQARHEGRTFLETAADAGEWRSSVFLGILARDGRDGPVDRKSALLHFQIAVLQGGEEAEHLLRHDLDKLSADIEVDERASISSAAHAWYEQRPFARKFIVKDPNVAKYFPLPSHTEIIKEAFTARSESSQQSR